MQHYAKLNNKAYENFMDYIQQILQHAKSFGSRSSILSVLAWIFGTLFLSTTLAGIFKSPTWLLVGMFTLLVIVLIAILVAFFYCLFTNRTDVLRSEKFNIEKLAIEKQTTSDSLTGVQPTKTLNDVSKSSYVDESEQDDDQ